MEWATIYLEIPKNDEELFKGFFREQSSSVELEEFTPFDSVYSIAKVRFKDATFIWWLGYYYGCEKTINRAGAELQNLKGYSRVVI